MQDGQGNVIGAFHEGVGGGIQTLYQGDGTELWSATGAPDPENMLAHYDATSLFLSDGESVNTWPNLASSDGDLTGGNPIYKESLLNELPGVEFDGVDDVLSESDLSNDRPDETWVVGRWVDDSTETFTDADSTADGVNAMLLRINDGDFSQFAGSNLNGPESDTEPHIFGNVYDGSDSVIEVDGVEFEGDAGDRPWENFQIGQGVSVTGPGHVQAHEIIIYENRDDDRRPDVREHLSSKWGVDL